MGCAEGGSGGMGTSKAPSSGEVSNQRKNSSWQYLPVARWRKVAQGGKVVQSHAACNAMSRTPHFLAHFIKGGRQLFVGYRRARQITRQAKLLHTALWFKRRCWTFLTQFGTMEHSIPGVFGAKQSSHWSTVWAVFDSVSVLRWGPNLQLQIAGPRGNPTPGRVARTAL